MRRLAFLFVLVPLAIVLVILSVANRHTVTMSFDPFGLLPAWTITVPLFVCLFAAVVLGIVIGGVATWFSQSRWRRAARIEHAEVGRLQRDVDQLRQQAAESPPALPARDAA